MINNSFSFIEIHGTFRPDERLNDIPNEENLLFEMEDHAKYDRWLLL